MIVRTLLVLWVASAPAPAPARPTSLPAQAPDTAARARLVDARAALDDSVSAVRRAAVRFGSDLGTASPDLVLTRARDVHQRCGAAVPAADSLARVLGARTYAAAAAQEQQAAHSEVVSLRRALARCAAQFNPGARHDPPLADSLRAWGPYRLSQLEQTTRRYEAALAAFRRKSRMI
ncbi:MAG: hypothetical protein ACREMR_04090 [Gemmatimonadales bacterium]